MKPEKVSDIIYALAFSAVVIIVALWGVNVIK